MVRSRVIIVKGHPPCARAPFSTSGPKHKMAIQTADYTKQRLFSLVDVEELDEVTNQYSPKGKHWMDVVTGSLYNTETGICLSSTQIKLLVNHAIQSHS